MLILTLEEVQRLHAYLIALQGGSFGLRDAGALESAVAQPQMTFAGQELYPTIEEKAAALAFSLIKNHPFVDGNKRIGHAAMETLLTMNDCEITAPQEEQEKTILLLASGKLSREEFVEWVRKNLGQITPI